MSLSIDPSRLVFVGGLHRSGTTPFARTLATHPEISGLTDTGVKEDEGQHLQDVYPQAKVYGGSGRFAYAEQAHLTESSPLVSPANAERMLTSWTPYWDLSRHVLVEKSPPNLIMGRFLQQVYPGSAFIAVVRHPVTVALSNKKWRRAVSRDPRKFETLSGLVKHWFAAHDTFREDLPKLERALVVYYEDLVTNPRQELDRVGEFLRLSTPIDDSSLSTKHSTVYTDAWDSYSRPPRPGWVQRQLIERQYTRRMADYGYSPDDLMSHDASAVPLV